MDNTQIALRILTVMLKKNMTQSDLAKELHVSREKVHRMVRGNDDFTIEMIESLEKILGIKIK